MLNGIEMFDVLRISRIFTVERDIREEAQDAALNLTLPFTITNNITGNVKVGGKYTRNNRETTTNAVV